MPYLNNRQTVELGDILRMGIETYQQANRLSNEQAKAVKSIISCRTQELGGHRKECDTCGFVQQAYNSCRNRHCPKCQYVKQEQWVDKLVSNLIPGKYYHLVFTVPHELLPLFLLNARACYAILFKAGSQALLKAAANPAFLGVQAGAVTILHTWTQTLVYHPHVHMLVPAGGLSEDGTEWKTSRKKFFLPAKVLSRIYRGIMVKTFENALNSGELKLPESIQSFSSLKEKLYKKDWNVYLKKAFGGVTSVLKYLGRYTHRVAISNCRIIAATGQEVSFRYKDNKVGGKRKVMTLATHEFIRRFLQHILPDNFYKIRYVGILAPVNSPTKKAQCLSLIETSNALPYLEGLNAMEVIELIMKTDILSCPKCRKGRMLYKFNDKR